MPSELLTERQGAVLILTISDPDTRNTLSEAVITAGIEALSTAESDDDVRCVVLRGAGQHFCAGGNLQGLMARRQAGPPAQARMLERLNQWVEALRACPKPVLAAVEGAAAGAGFSLTLACDMIVAAEDAKFILSYAKLGLSPDGGASWQLLRALPRQAVQQMVWLAEPVSARQLQGWGIVNAVTEPGNALAVALRLADRLSAMAPNAVASGKELLNAAADQPLNAQLGAERDHFIVNLFHANGGEGIQAFVGKRAPRFE
ncbi:enoyl-CoA hydratase/isomerase family protein [Rhizobacter sp. AJA081-3]|uniref:oxepin-CoA hydrolase, alternative type n=1 Tax=Rhizobacter sp. AJA081-3 TaxID=2753607 RepID=UPI001ADFA915|nr:enoyl-CoA hydratase [Rhizobacter sp. AJA081-3]QTN25275.1 enoyl-CoA hydratase/isomerase family protein [Rhizobacter sp. AJA081-3]